MFLSRPNVTVVPMSIEQIGQRLRIARERLGLTQNEVARRTDIRENSIGRFERGDMVPKTVSVLSLCEALLITPQWLLTGEEVGSDRALPPPQGLSEYLASGEAASLTLDERAALTEMGHAIQRAKLVPTPYTYAALAGVLRSLTPVPTSD